MYKPHPNSPTPRRAERGFPLPVGEGSEWPRLLLEDVA